MSTGYLPVLGAALRHGPWVAGACAFAVTPGSLVVLARLLERRWLVPGEQFTAVTYGDPALAITVGLGVSLAGTRSPHGVTGAFAGWVTVAVLLLFGLAQWRGELRRGYYTRAQAMAPTKIWHQVVIYPVMGYWVWTSCLGGLSAGGSWVAKVLLVAFLGVWVATNVYDRGHPKLGHPPFDWRHGRPQARPWAAESQTLRSRSLWPLGAGPLAAGRWPSEVLYVFRAICLTWCCCGQVRLAACENSPRRGLRSGSSRGRAGPSGTGT